ncbi:MAG: enoyl-CoA hydratase/isomerase family protein [Hyphomonadaceae bacterium]|jgi:enoyl-CoA hydratase/carnithine racemase|nr:enoyl-CoA hydratase/isomerase family protein [Hyphomonadaceae bacterium]
MSTSSDFRVSEREGILEFVFTRAEKLNALTLPMVQGLWDAVQTLASRKDLRVLLIRAEGRYFSAGIDLNSELSPSFEITSPTEFRRWYRNGVGSMHPLFDEIEGVEKPVVIAHQAACLGGAFEMSLSCDFRLAAKSARYALPETALGGIPGSGGTSRLTRIVGPHWARWFIMANLAMEAERALAVGLVHDVYPDETFESDVWSFCQNLAKQPPETVAAAKLAIELVADLDRQQARNVERLTVSGLVMGEEFKTLMGAMRERLGHKK